MNIAIAIATKDGSGHLDACLESCVHQADTYVVSDGSSDDTGAVAQRWTDTTLVLEENVGKPRAISMLIGHYHLADRYDYVAIVDDDTILAPDFIEQMRVAATDKPEIVNGAVASQRSRKWWNPWLAGRVISYWRNHVTIRRGTSALRAMTWVSGASSMFKCPDTLNLWRQPIRYIVDDTQICLETVRTGGRIQYAPYAMAYVQDPVDFRAWWKQTTRWMWGTFQGVRGHKVLRKATWFDLIYFTLIFDMILYLLTPVLMVAGITLLHFTLWWVGIGLVAGPLCWTVASMIRFRRPSLLLHLPHIIVVQDVLYRALLIHCVWKAWRRPTVETCVWDSPAREIV